MGLSYTAFMAAVLLQGEGVRGGSDYGLQMFLLARRQLIDFRGDSISTPSKQMSKCLYCTNNSFVFLVHSGKKNK